MPSMSCRRPWATCRVSVGRLALHMVDERKEAGLTWATCRLAFTWCIGAELCSEHPIGTWTGWHWPWPSLVVMYRAICL